VEASFFGRITWNSFWNRFHDLKRYVNISLRKYQFWFVDLLFQNTFREILPFYYIYLSRYPNTLLSRVYGYHQLKHTKLAHYWIFSLFFWMSFSLIFSLYALFNLLFFLVDNKRDFWFWKMFFLLWWLSIHNMTSKVDWWVFSFSVWLFFFRRVNDRSRSWRQEDERRRDRRERPRLYENSGLLFDFNFLIVIYSDKNQKQLRVGPKKKSLLMQQVWDLLVSILSILTFFTLVGYWYKIFVSIQYYRLFSASWN
jgi:hypothetical protein